MTLSPFEVERREFSRVPLGYRPRDVDSFLDEVHRSLSQLWQERGDAREKAERLEERLARFEQLEDQLKNTLLLAQDAAEKSHEQARRESDLVLREAGQQARDLVNKAHEDKQRLEMVLRDLTSAEQEARQRLRAMSGAIISHLDDTEQLVADGAATFRAVVQAHPEATELRASYTSELRLDAIQRVDAELANVAPADELVASAGVLATATEPPLAPPLTDEELQERGAVRAHGDTADAFFDAPPTFDPSEVRRREPVGAVD